MRLLVTVVILVNLHGPFVAGGMTAIVNTTTGPVQGEILSTVHSVRYAAFRGIRFAEPPVGYLRFKPPVPIEPWKETLNATKEGSKCPQHNSDSIVIGSEDCLFLNVFTPTTDLSKTPTVLKSVMVWIYGGAFVEGWTDSDANRPDFLLERDVVYVALNYRLGALGFLSLNHPNATGNQGLKDQRLALKWVQANIEKFGGNPKNVTIFGESAGAVSVGFHVLSDSSKGLFHGAIYMSGTPLVPWGFMSRDLAVSRAQILATLLGAFPFTDEEYFKTLYAATPEQLVDTSVYVDPIIPFNPTLEDASIATEVFLSKCSISKYTSGNFSKVPQLLGFMQQETVTFLNNLSAFLALINEVTNYAEFVSSAVFDGLSVLEDLSQGVDHLVGVVETGILETAVNVTTDVLFKAQIDETQRLLVKDIGEQPVYYYEISFSTNRSRHNLESNYSLDGAGHADDLAYVFYIPANNYNLSLSDPMGLTIYRVSTMWTNFAKYGNPTPNWIHEYPVNVTWPSSGSSGQALEIGNELTVVPRPINTGTKTIEIPLTPLLPYFADCDHSN